MDINEREQKLLWLLKSSLSNGNNVSDKLDDIFRMNEFSNWKLSLLVSGGNQRELARAKSQKKLADAKKGVRTDNLTVDQRKAR